MRTRQDYDRLVKFHGLRPAEATIIEVLLDIRDLLNGIDTRLAEAAEGRMNIRIEPDWTHIAGLGAAIDKQLTKQKVRKPRRKKSAHKR